MAPASSDRRRCPRSSNAAGRFEYSVAHARTANAETTRGCDHAQIARPGITEAALDGVEAVVHLAAALPRDGMTAETIHAVNTEGTGNPESAAAARGSSVCA